MKNELNISEIIAAIREQVEEDVLINDELVTRHHEDDDTHKSCPALKILSMVGGFLASIALLGFIFIAGLYNSEPAMVVTGVLFLVASVAIIIRENKLVVATIAVSFYLIGYGLIAAGLGFSNVDSGLICIAFIVLAAVSMVFTQNWIFAFISVLLINGGVIGLILLNRSFNLVNIYVPVVLVAFLWVTMNEAKLLSFGVKIGRLYEPIRLGLLVSLITGLVFVGVRELITLNPNHVILSAIATIGGVLFLVWKLLPVLDVQNKSTKILVYALSILMLAPTVASPALSGSIVIILASFYVNYKPGLVIGLIAFIFFLSQYYYDLHFTLLLKSGILLLTGLIFIVCYFVTLKKLNPDEKV